MEVLPGRLDAVDQRITSWMARHGLSLLRISLGVVFFWFGVLKFFQGMSLASDLAARTIGVLSFGMVPASLSVPFLAAWECVIGLGLTVGISKDNTSSRTPC